MTTASDPLRAKVAAKLKAVREEPTTPGFDRRPFIWFNAIDRAGTPVAMGVRDIATDPATVDDILKICERNNVDPETLFE